MIENADHCVELSKQIGYPVMVKASGGLGLHDSWRRGCFSRNALHLMFNEVNYSFAAGGGGKGMRIAWNDDEAAMAFRLCSEEVQSYSLHFHKAGII